MDDEQTTTGTTTTAATEPDLADLQQRLTASIQLLQTDQIEAAEQALNDILRIQPRQPDALHFLGVVRHAQGRTHEALTLIDQSLRIVPGHAGAWNNMGNVLMTIGVFEEAVTAYENSARVAAGRPESAEALSNLGTLYRRLQRLAEAEEACRRAVEVRPDLSDAWYNLSQVLIAQGKVHEGLLANSRATTLSPRHGGREQVLRALLLLGERERAAQMYRDWLEEQPDDPLARHHLAACEGDAPPERASDAYVQTVFDSFSRSFDVKLEQLHYRAPELVTAALGAAAGPARAALDVLDAGCGTGLCGPLIRPWAKRLAGCDLSIGMLRRAGARGGYDVLHQAELVFYMETQPAAFDAVISADTLCYFGPLDKPMAAAGRCLRSGGLLVFTVEALPADATDEHTLQLNGRYAHAERHVRATAARGGLTVVDIRGDVLREEAGLPVAGWVVTARKA
jgi:predicted TPR repeat methyltransferase